jgi:hypothetical protein
MKPAVGYRKEMYYIGVRCDYAVVEQVLGSCKVQPGGSTLHTYGSLLMVHAGPGAQRTGAVVLISSGGECN